MKNFVKNQIDSENEQSLREFNEIYADLENDNLNESITDTTYSSKEFREIALSILKEIYEQ